MPRRRRIIAELAPERQHVHVQRLPPGRHDRLSTRDRPARVGHQLREQIELARAQAQFLAVLPRPAARAINTQPTGDQLAVRRAPRVAAAARHAETAPPTGVVAFHPDVRSVALPRARRARSRIHPRRRAALGVARESAQVAVGQEAQSSISGQRAARAPSSVSAGRAAGVGRKAALIDGMRESRSAGRAIAGRQVDASLRHRDHVAERYWASARARRSRPLLGTRLSHAPDPQDSRPRTAGDRGFGTRARSVLGLR